MRPARVLWAWGPVPSHPSQACGGRFCAVGLCSRRECACPKSQPVSGRADPETRPLARRSVPCQARCKPKGLGAVCRPEDSLPLGTGVFYRGQGVGFFSRHESCAWLLRWLP